MALALSWQPRGELPRFQRLWPLARALYDEVVVAITDAEPDQVAALEALGVHTVTFEDWTGRHAVLERALATNADHIHYVDFDRVVRWLELHPDELRATAARLAACDMLVIGRTSAAYRTHPQSMITTEGIANRVVSAWFGRAMDFCAGSRGFSRRAAQMVLKADLPRNSLVMDAGWAVLARRAGMTVDYVEVDGLDWETADRHLEHAASAEQQRELAAQHDRDPDHWARRVSVADHIIDFGLRALNLEIPQEQTR